MPRVSPTTRKFGNKIYHYVGWYKTLASAKSAVSMMRRRGFFARYYPEARGYSIWSSPKSNPIHPQAIESLKRYKDDLKAGHTSAAEFWRGQAGAYFTTNPNDPSHRCPYCKYRWSTVYKTPRCPRCKEILGRYGEAYWWLKKNPLGEALITGLGLGAGWAVASAGAKKLTKANPVLKTGRFNPLTGVPLSKMSRSDVAYYHAHHHGWVRYAKTSSRYSEIKRSHDKVVREMKRRGIQHLSPIA